MDDGIASSLEKEDLRKSVEWGEIKMSGELTITALSKRLVSVGWHWRAFIHLVY
jgi:hypothetical protein